MDVKTNINIEREHNSFLKDFVAPMKALSHSITLLGISIGLAIKISVHYFVKRMKSDEK